MRYLSLFEVLELHELVLEQSGGTTGIRDLGALESAVAQPRMTFDGVDLYQTIQEKAAALCFSLVMGHSFEDGNKRVGHAAMETFLILNDWELDAAIDDSERTILSLAAGTLSRDEFVQWVSEHSRFQGY
ncbi:MAG: type II toxin-antitoxin system death-on-curing family toxin [Chloroflexi bacterium]|nr:type II toxin-antitoxin system death-on-curing family toxin [Chloroflexota bacterium]